jgi:hypothetical protein
MLKIAYHTRTRSHKWKRLPGTKFPTYKLRDFISRYYEKDTDLIICDRKQQGGHAIQSKDGYGSSLTDPANPAEHLVETARLAAQIYIKF